MAGKKRKNKLSKSLLEDYRQMLTDKMQEMIGDVSMIEESALQGSGELSNMPFHLADIGTDSYEQEFNLGLVEEEKKILEEIYHALGRIEDGSFGICEGLGIPIEENRLQAIPWTRYSLQYAQLLESGKAFAADSLENRRNSA